MLRDAAETIGLEISEPELQKSNVDTKENNRLKAKLDEVSRREQIKDMELAQLRAKVSLLSNFGGLVVVRQGPSNWFIQLRKENQFFCRYQLRKSAL